MILFHRRDIKFLVLIVFVAIVLQLGGQWLLTQFGRSPMVVASEPFSIILREKVSSEFHATGYSLGRPYDNITRSGSLVMNRGAVQICGIEVFTIAVDPKVIPLGSVVYIDSLGLAMATDTGPGIKGMEIDICFQDMTKAMIWGRRVVRLTMVRRGF